MNKVKQYIWNKDEPLIIMAKAELLLSETHSNVENLGLLDFFYCFCILIEI